MARWKIPSKTFKSLRTIDSQLNQVMDLYEKGMPVTTRVLQAEEIHRKAVQSIQDMRTQGVKIIPESVTLGKLKALAHEAGALKRSAINDVRNLRR